MMFEAPSFRIMAAVSTYLLGAATSEWPVYENGTKEIMAPPRVSGITTHNATMFGTTLPRVETRCLGYLTLISSSHLIHNQRRYKHQHCKPCTLEIIMSIRRFVIIEKAPTRAFSWLKVPSSAFTFKNLLRCYAEWVLDMKCRDYKWRTGWFA